MTIQEAIKSGKYFYRASNIDHMCRVEQYSESEKDYRAGHGILINGYWYSGLFSKIGEYDFCKPEYSGFEALFVENILADDWEVIEKEEIAQLEKERNNDTNN